MLSLPIMTCASYISSRANATPAFKGAIFIGGLSCRNLFWGTNRISNHQKKKVELARFVPLRNGGFREEEDILTSAYQMLGRLEASLNGMSKWLVGVLFAIAIIWKHDGVTIWVALGAFLNSFISTTLKKMLNHQRPSSALRSDPGMPSSHAQSIFYAVVFAIHSVMEGMGVNVNSVVVGAIIFSCGAYLSWLRVSQNLHTINQILVGAALGSTCSLMWLWIWHFLLLLRPLDTWFAARPILLLGAAVYYAVLLLSAIRHWLHEDYK